MLEFLSLDIVCSSNLTVFFSEQIMSADKYPSIFSLQMEAIVYIFSSRMEPNGVYYPSNLFLRAKTGDYLAIIE